MTKSPLLTDKQMFSIIAEDVNREVLKAFPGTEKVSGMYHAVSEAQYDICMKWHLKELRGIFREMEKMFPAHDFSLLEKEWQELKEKYGVEDGNSI